MDRFTRGLLTLFLACAAVAVALIAIVSLAPAGEGNLYNLEKSRQIQADLQEIGDFTEAFRAEHRRLPVRAELAAWMAGHKWHIVDRAGTIQLVTDAGCLGDSSQLSEGSGSYRICYWRGEWFEEYAPETGETSLPQSVDDYDAPWYLEPFLIGGTLAIVGLLISLHRRRPEPQIG